MPAVTTPSFAALGVPERLVAALRREGITTPFPIQAATLVDALAGRDVLGRAQTGSGKTLAFGLPALARLTGRTAHPKRPLALILVPTRELAAQVHDALAPLAAPLDIAVSVVVGGVNMGRQIQALRRGVEVLVATPGRLEDLIAQRVCDLSAVELVVLDEADRMSDMGFLPAVRRLLDQTKPRGQRLLFSATLDAAVQTVVRGYLEDPMTHTTTPVGVEVAEMAHHVLVLAQDDKVTITAQIANRAGRTLLFVRTKHGADRLTKQLRRAGVAAEALHGGKTQGARTRTLSDFREGRVSALVATDVAARGIHVDGIDLVVHVDPAADHKDYLHRAGRTARAGERGTVVSLVTHDQQRATADMTRKAGVRTSAMRVTPGDSDLVRVTGARPTPATPVSAAPQRRGPGMRTGSPVRHPQPGRGRRR